MMIAGSLGCLAWRLANGALIEVKTVPSLFKKTSLADTIFFYFHACRRKSNQIDQAAWSIG